VGSHNILVEKLYAQEDNTRSGFIILEGDESEGSITSLFIFATGAQVYGA
jgi:hypothetical protein